MADVTRVPSNGPEDHDQGELRSDRCRAAVTATGHSGTAQLAGDSFGQKAPKLDVLVGGSRGGRVLLIGVPLEEWCGDFSAHFNSVAFASTVADLDAALGTGAMYNMVVWDMGELAWGSLTKWLHQVRAALVPDGTLIVFADNRLALRRLVRDPLRLVAQTVVTTVGLRAALRRTGFTRIDEYVPLPERRGAEEFVSRLYGDIELPSHAARVERALRFSGLLPIFHDGIVCIASGGSGGSQALLDQLARSLLPAADKSDGLQLERFDLRARGALVLMLRHRGAEERLVCRITTDEAVDRVVSRNAEWTSLIHNSDHVSAEVKQRVPRPRKVIDLGAATAYVEERIEGVVAWKLVRQRHLEPTLFNGTYRLLSKFNRDTAVLGPLDSRLLGQLLTPEDWPWVDQEVSGVLRRIQEVLCERLLDQNHVIVWGHGDFGYGNVIADPSGSAVKGIIDWDQGRIDLAGIDLLNFLVQRLRIVEGCTLQHALQHVAETAGSKGLKAADARIDYEAYFPTYAEHRLTSVAWSAMRFAERSIQYPGLFQRSRAEILQVLFWGLRLLS